MKLLWIYVICALTLHSNGSFLDERIRIPTISAESFHYLNIWKVMLMFRDQFDLSNNDTWFMWYNNNDEFFKPGGPIFINIGGESNIFGLPLIAGQMYDMAEENNGYMFQIEHRYYGDSYVTQDLTTANLKYLTRDQALRDIATFIKVQKLIKPQLANSKVILVGGSYAATLAIWARLIYPDFIYAALASSPTIKPAINYREYYEIVGEQIGLQSKECLDTIRLGTAQIEAALKTPLGIQQVEKLLNTCVPIDTTSPAIDYLFNILAASFAVLLRDAEVGEIESECNILMTYSGTEMEKLTTYMRIKNYPNCFNDYNQYIIDYSDTNLNNTDRAWLYQKCTEIGHFQTSDSPNQPFGQTFGLNLDLSLCKDLFGLNYTETVLQRVADRTNSLLFGASKLSITNVVTVHGTADPWHKLGILKNLSSSAPVILVNGTTHCADLWDTTIPQLQEAKRMVSMYIKQWISQIPIYPIPNSPIPISPIHIDPIPINPEPISPIPISPTPEKSGNKFTIGIIVMIIAILCIVTCLIVKLKGSDIWTKMRYKLVNLR